MYIAVMHSYNMKTTGHLRTSNMNFWPVAKLTGQHVPSYTSCIATYSVLSAVIIVI